MNAPRTPALQLIDVEMTFPGVHALKNVSIDIMPSEIVGLIGENGAGDLQDRQSPPLSAGAPPPRPPPARSRR